MPTAGVLQYLFEKQWLVAGGSDIFSDPCSTIPRSLFEFLVSSRLFLVLKILLGEPPRNALKT